ncbi:radical SAM/SPASM domain-containing protein [Paraclostridium sordellii]|uniref:radical SAM/SPASM domain-containing protein n=1 Tax=Paraclostridium sordellii TaxID=1505 RepID=UPI0005DEC440|nr:radical SAM protein [Paeniclostridium sordellii]CEQ18958.1 putative Fe-S oxidoreductase [[Clostridium] sordellii] [Paeniclostridium sordellii]
MYEINTDVIYIKGATNGAIYDFNTNNVYSINSIACNIIDKLTKEEKILLEEEKSYINLLIQNNLLNKDIKIDRYIPKIENNIDLSLVWLEVTQGCNLKCLHCYEGDIHIPSKNVLNINEWKNIVDQLVELDVQNIVVIGGEPCVYKDIKELLLYLAKYNINTTLFTNATLIDEELRKIIIDNNINVKVSLYGHIAEIHDAITNKEGSFKALIDNIKYFVDKGVKIYISVVAMKENQEYQKEIEEFIKSLKVPYKGYDVIRNVFEGKQSMHTPDKEEIILSSKRNKPSFWTTKEQFNINYFRNTCWYGKLVITETGEILPCVFERNLSYGNINRQSIKDILNSKELRENWFRDFSKVNVCKDCEFRFACKDCRPLGISIKGSILDKSPRCTYNPYCGEWDD